MDDDVHNINVTHNNYFLFFFCLVVTPLIVYIFYFVRIIESRKFDGTHMVLRGKFFK